jgi:hypothetical protein
MKNNKSKFRYIPKVPLIREEYYIGVAGKDKWFEKMFGRKDD